MTPTPESRGIVLMLLSIFFFTVNTLAVRALALSYPACDGWIVTLFRGIAGTLLVVVLYSRSGSLRLKSLFDRPRIMARGVLGTVGVVLYYLTILELGATRAVVINLTYPIFAALFARVFLGEHLSTRQLTWIITGFAGLLIFLSPKCLESGPGLYDLLAILGAGTAAVVVVLIRSLHRSEHSSTIFASQAVYCVALAAPLTVGTPAPPPAALGLLFLAGLVVAGGQLAMTFAYRHLPVSRGASLQLLLPIATGIGAWFLFNETIGPVEIAGASLTLLATYKVHPRTSKTNQPTISNPTSRP